MRTVREKLRDEIQELDEFLARMVEQVLPEHRSEPAFQEQLDALLARRSSLMTQRDMGFRITDRRRVRT